VVKEKKTKRIRAWELDFMRGIAIILVAFDHSMFDIKYLFGEMWKVSSEQWLIKLNTFANNYYYSDLRAFWWPIFVAMFFIVSGICTAFSRNNFRRALRLAVVALLLTLSTFIIEKVAGMSQGSVMVVFGVLHCMASSIFIFAVINAPLNAIRRSRWIKVIVFSVLGIIILVLYSAYFPSIGTVGPETSYQSEKFFVGIWVFSSGFWKTTADYFPIIPYLGFFFLGSAIASIFYYNRKSLLPVLDGKWHYPLTIPGRFSVFVYLGFRVLDIGVFALITYIYTGSIGLI
jgi:uncharacterized membrane protein